MKTRYHHAIRLASTSTLSREAWLQIRQQGIGSSDAAVAIGLSPYKSPLSLWLEKTHRKAPDDLSEKEAVIWGTVLEPVLASVYAERTGKGTPCECRASAHRLSLHVGEPGSGSVRPRR